MTQAADLVLTNGEIRTLTGETAQAVAIRDGTIVRVGRSTEIEFLSGVETRVIDLDGQVVLPGFVDAHTHLDVLGRQLQETDLTRADSAAGCLDRLAKRREETAAGWVIGFGYDESRWGEGHLTRDQLDTISTERPVAAFREDRHLVSVNSVVLDRFGEKLPASGVHRADGEPTGVLVEEALAVVETNIQPDLEQLRSHLLAAQKAAHRHGVTAVHEMACDARTPRVYRELDLAGELTLRVRLNYRVDHLDGVLDAGLRTNHGSDRLTVGGIKAFADGSIGGHTARLADPYVDAETRGEWVRSPEQLESLVSRVDDAGLQMAVHAIGDEAIEAVLDAYEHTAGSRHRIEHCELLRSSLLDRLETVDAVASVQPNFLKWARDGGLYDERLGETRRTHSNQFHELLASGVHLAFGSDCMPLDPLFGIEQAVTAPEPTQRLSVTDAIRAYTIGGAYAGFDEDRLGTIEPGKCGDVVVLDDSPWETDDLSAIDAVLTVVGGEIVYDGR